MSEYANLSGRGGLKYAARWHSVGRPIVYAAEHPALAILEMFVHVEEAADLPDNFQLLGIDLPDLLPETPPCDFDPANDHAARAWGNDWLARAETATARVPSMIVPQAWNWLLNPAHPQAGSARVAETWRHPWDERLRGKC